MFIGSFGIDGIDGIDGIKQKNVAFRIIEPIGGSTGSQKINIQNVIVGSMGSTGSQKKNVVGDRRDRCYRTIKKVMGDRRDRCCRTIKKVMMGSTGSTGSQEKKKSKCDWGIDGIDGIAEKKVSTHVEGLCKEMKPCTSSTIYTLTYMYIA